MAEHARPASREITLTRPILTMQRKPAAVSKHPSLPIDVLPGVPGVGASIRREIAGTGIQVFPIGLGGSVFGWTVSTDSTARILDKYADFGGNFLDTADSYSGGLSEVQIGNWMRHRRNRDTMVVATKVGRNADSPGLGPVSVVRAVEASLERLGTDYVDVLYLHGEDLDVPIEDTLGTVEWLIETGKVRALGAADFSAERLVEARIISAAGYPQFSAYTTEYSLANRTGFEGDRRLVALGQGLSVMPYFALGSGFLTGKFRSRSDFGPGIRSVRAAAHWGRRGVRILHALDEVAAEAHCSVAAAALAWLLSKPGIVAPIVSASRPEHVDAMISAAGIRLSRSQVVELDRASR